jgi:hypothetical protein
VVQPNEHRIDIGVEPDRIWRDAEPIVASLILAPQLEQISLDWALRCAAHATFEGTVSAAGPTTIGTAQVNLAAVEHTSTGATRVLALGEVKARTTRIGVDVVERLDDLSERLIRSNPKNLIVGPGIKRMIVSRSGFTNDLRRLADRRPTSNSSISTASASASNRQADAPEAERDSHYGIDDVSAGRCHVWAFLATAMKCTDRMGCDRQRIAT